MYNLIHSDTVSTEFLFRRMDNLQQSIDSLSIANHDALIGKEYFESILNQQQNLFGILTAIFSIVVLLAVGMSWLWYIRKLENRINFLNQKIGEITAKFDKISTIESQLLDVNMDTKRALWEGAQKYTFMRLIWHIRYCETFIQRNHHGFLDDINWHFIKRPDENTIHLEYTSIKGTSHEYYRFINFQNIGGIKKILRNILELAHHDKYIDMRKIASGILHDIEMGYSLSNGKGQTGTVTPED